MCKFPRVRNTSARKTQSKSAKAMSSMSKNVGCNDEPGVKSCEMSPEGCSVCVSTVLGDNEGVSFDEDMVGHNDYAKLAQLRCARPRGPPPSPSNLLCGVAVVV